MIKRRDPVQLVSMAIVASRRGPGKGSFTFVEHLYTDNYNFETRVLGNRQLLLLIVGCGHPEGQPTVFDKSLASKC